MKIRITAAPGELEEKRQEVLHQLVKADILPKSFVSIGEEDINETFSFRGLEVCVEKLAGGLRHGRPLLMDYGYFPGVPAPDGDDLDVFVGPYAEDEHADESDMVYIVHQISPDTGRYDEDKVFIGCRSAIEVKKTYLLQYSQGHFGALSAIPVDYFVDNILAIKELGPKLLNSYSCGADTRKSSVDSGLADSVLLGEFRDLRPVVEVSKSLDTVPASLLYAASRSRQASYDEGDSHTSRANLVFGGDLAKGPHLASEVDGFLNRPGEASVLSTMFGLSENLQVVDGVVRPVAIFVVDDLVRAELPPECDLNNISVFRDCLAVNGNRPVRLIASPNVLATSGRVSGGEVEILHRSSNELSDITQNSLTHETIKTSPAGNRHVNTGGATNFIYRTGPGPMAPAVAQLSTVEQLKEMTDEPGRGYELTVEDLEDLNPQVPYAPHNEVREVPEDPYGIDPDKARKDQMEVGKQVLEVGRKRVSNSYSSPFSTDRKPPISTSPDELKTKRTADQ